ncbi:MAG TPA: lipase maturation factor family protein, partial [Candidatus Binatia bacterium]|nr:lipase maturation factor family protein [Candidatus Binatia bacterium]
MDRRAADRASYWLTRFVILRFLGFVYCFAFFSLARQVLPLIGSQGLTPVGQFLELVRDVRGSSLDGFRSYPSLFWLDHSDVLLSRLAWVGLA